MELRPPGRTFYNPLMFPTNLRHFRSDENFGSPDLMDHSLLYVLDEWRADLGIPVYVSRGYDEQAAKHSAHRPQADGNAYAVDVIPCLQGTDVTLFDCFQLALRYDFYGVGIYPDWRYTFETGGLHLDRHPRRNFRGWQRAGTWIGYRENGKPKYAGVTTFNLKKYGLLP